MSDQGQSSKIMRQRAKSKKIESLKLKAEIFKKENKKSKQLVWQRNLARACMPKEDQGKIIFLWKRNICFNPPPRYMEILYKTNEPNPGSREG